MSLRNTDKSIKRLQDEIVSIERDAYENVTKAANIRTQLKNWGNGVTNYSTLDFGHLGPEAYLERLSAFRALVKGDEAFVGIHGVATLDTVSDIDRGLFRSLCQEACVEADRALEAFGRFAPPNHADEVSAANLQKQMRELAGQLYVIDNAVASATGSYSARNLERENTLRDEKSTYEKRLLDQQSTKREALRQLKMPTTLIAALALLISFGALIASIVRKPAVTVEIQMPQTVDHGVGAGAKPLPNVEPRK